MQPVSNKATLIDRLHSNERAIKAFGVVDLDLFGSFLNDSAVTVNSDVDLLVNFRDNEKTFDNLMELGFFLEDLLGRKVELITPASLSKYIGPHIVKRTENVIR